MQGGRADTKGTLHHSTWDNGKGGTLGSNTQKAITFRVGTVEDHCRVLHGESV